MLGIGSYRRGILLISLLLNILVNLFENSTLDIYVTKMFPSYAATTVE
jgi:hypothetical protein